MNRFAIATIVILLAVRGANAGDPWPGGKCAPACCPSGLMLCCPDDYCRKPVPCVPCPLFGCCPNYCRKPIPCVPCPRLGGCSAYCRKPIPCLCWPPLPAIYSCGECKCKQHCEESPDYLPGIGRK